LSYGRVAPWRAVVDGTGSGPVRPNGSRAAG